MSKKAKSNIACAGQMFEQGKIYPNEAVAHLDPNDFEDVVDEANAAPENGSFIEKERAEAQKKSQQASSSASSEVSTPAIDAAALGAKEALE